jgi:hypothetical protein
VRLLISRVCAIGLNFLLLTAATYFAARSVDDLFIMSWAAPAVPPARMMMSQPSSRHLLRASYDPIVERDVFNAVKQSAPEEPVVQSLDLHLKLIGTSHLSMAEPWAIIEDERSHQQSLYKLGSDVIDAGKLMTIEKDRVLINHGGQLVALEIPKDFSPGGGDNPASSQKAEDFAKEQQNVLLQHKLHPRRARLDRGDREDKMQDKEADKAARRNARMSRRYSRMGALGANPNPAGGPGGGPAAQPLPPRANQLFQPQSPDNSGSESD